MQITSPVFQNNSQLPKDYSCDGKGINPPLLFSDVPQNAKSLVLIVDDPDAPIGTFVHWVVYNMPPTTTEIAENTIPQGILGKNGIGRTGFVAACPPSGEHRYFFKLYALDKEISGSGLDKEDLEQLMQGHILAQTQLIGLYKRVTT